jgi:hypothetical protein
MIEFKGTGSLRKFIEAADKKLKDYLKRFDADDAEERASGGSRVKNLAEKIEALTKKRGEYAAHLYALEESGESQVSLTDPDSAPWRRIRRSASATTFRSPSTPSTR